MEDSPVGSNSGTDQVSQGENQQKRSSSAARDPPPQPQATKRRRITRACDECRRKKIKCDGNHPCAHCLAYSYTCSYDQPSQRKRVPAPQYVENLEARLQRAETLLRTVMPNLNLDDPWVDAALAQGSVPGLGAQAPNSSEGGNEPALETIVPALAQMNLDETGHWDYHGNSSGLSFVRGLGEQLGNLPGPESLGASSIGKSPARVLPRGFLPEREIARRYCQYAMDQSSALLHIVHAPSFWKSFNRIYALPSDTYTPSDRQFMALFYSAMALGYLYGEDEPSTVRQQGYKSAIELGIDYFNAARGLLDFVDCRDLASMQALLFIILFLQSSARLSECYVYIGIALRSALRMGLHRAHNGSSNHIENELRKRLFWIVLQMDIYVGALLGLPQTLKEEDIDQEFPAEVDDEGITENSIGEPTGHSTMIAFNHYTRLAQLMGKIVRNIYPTKSPIAGSNKSYPVSYALIHEIERDLGQWKRNLPGVLTGNQPPEHLGRAQHLLRIAFNKTQFMLYRPFLHFVSAQKRSATADKRAYACAASCINLSRSLIHIAAETEHRGFLHGACWFVMYSVFFAIISLVHFAMENPTDTRTRAIVNDAYEGQRLLKSLARRSMAADRCAATLESVLNRLPGRLSNEKAQMSSSQSKQPVQLGPSLPIEEQQISPGPALFAENYPSQLLQPQKEQPVAFPLSQNLWNVVPATEELPQDYNFGFPIEPFDYGSQPFTNISNPNWMGTGGGEVPMLDDMIEAHFPPYLEHVQQVVPTNAAENQNERPFELDVNLSPLDQ
ncbi:hypothetical protein K470DRAFT_239136 [Piedraia hortae CBS 480.64]|uniref:Zn(2)-C6 fungal-type domain-containing protein n=1 Tax=Piedraia hortae CBS 480.64 TaxID=1314780 RepID=A0A6A7CB43_9PEZI|nr:hypothetical protein K470DRAFT_239136 [Piedraia hortae CBS 480.64]